MLMSRLMLALLLMSGAIPVAAQGTADASHAPLSGWPTCRPDQVQVMLLGTFHMANPGLDEVNVEADDVRAPKRQRELEELARRLASWRPDRIAVEHSYRGQAKLDSALRRLETGAPMTARDETQQVGMRLALLLNHGTVYGIDYPMRLGNDSAAALWERGFEPENKISYQTRDPKAIEREETDRLRRSTIIEYLMWLNGDSKLRGNHDLMFPNLSRGTRDNFGGPMMLASWYDRNFRMAHLIWRAVHPSDRRVLAIVGSGHVRPLRHIIDESPMLCPVSPLGVLGQ